MSKTNALLIGIASILFFSHQTHAAADRSFLGDNRYWMVTWKFIKPEHQQLIERDLKEYQKESLKAFKNGLGYWAPRTLLKTLLNRCDHYFFHSPAPAVEGLDGMKLIPIVSNHWEQLNKTEGSQLLTYLPLIGDLFKSKARKQAETTYGTSLILQGSVACKLVNNYRIRLTEGLKNRALWQQRIAQEFECLSSMFNERHLTTEILLQYYGRQSYEKFFQEKIEEIETFFGLANNESRIEELDGGAFELPWIRSE